MEGALLKGRSIREVENHCRLTTYPRPCGVQRRSAKGETGPQYREEKADEI